MKRMRKRLVGLVTILALLVSAVCVTMTGYGFDAVHTGRTEGRDYLKQDVKMLDKDFEDLKGSSFIGNAISSLYLNKSAVIEEADALAGTQSLKFNLPDASDEFGTQVFALDGTGAAAFREAGNYYFKFKLKPNKATKIILEVRNAWSNDRAGVLAEYRRGIDYSDGGAVIGVTDDSRNGFRTIWEPFDVNPGYKNESTLTDGGFIDVYFEYEIAAGLNWGDAFCPNFAFKAIYPGDSQLIFDDISIGKVGQPAKYFTKVVDSDFDSILNEGNVWELQPIWANNCGFETELPLEGTASMKIWSPAATDNQTIAGLTSNAPGEVKNFSNEIGLYYYQFDVNFGNFTDFNFWTSGTDYLSVQFKNNAGAFTFKSEGKALNLRAIDMGDFSRVSFYVDYATESVEHKINTTGPAGSEMLIDNFIIAKEDYTPYTENGSFNRIDPTDVAVTVDDKDKDFAKINVRGGADLVKETDYTVGDGKVTFKNSYFTGKTENINLEYCTSGGVSDILLSVVDNRKEITAITPSGTLEKEYDGTDECNSLEGITFALTGATPEDSDNLTLTYSAAYADKNAGDTTVNLINLSLTGSAAPRYKLAAGLNVSVTAKINPIKLTVSGTQASVTKQYDGSDTATVTEVGTLAGVLTGEEVNLTADAKFNTRNVGADTVTVSFSVGNDNYAAPDNIVITEGVSILKKTVAVTADSLEKKAGETDPEFTYSAVGLIAGDSLSGTLIRETGEAAGEYAIKIGTLNGENYAINFTEGVFKITAKTGKGCASVLTEGGPFNGIGTVALALCIMVLLALIAGKRTGAFKGDN